MARKVKQILEKQGRETVLCPVFETELEICPLPTGKGEHTAGLAEEMPSAEMIITFGGDGTILHAARAAAEFGVPILGVNIGGKGFIAELEAEDLGLVDSVAGGGYGLESRMMLDVEVKRGGVVVCNDFALNDVVVRGDNKVIDLAIYGDGQKISRFYGDGAVIATPTGSTAYSMSAGGPIVEPAASNIILTPICAHALETKSFVLVSDRRVSVELGDKKHNPAYLSVDGGDHVSIKSGDVIDIVKSQKCTLLVRLSKRSFYKKVSEKLGERT